MLPYPAELGHSDVKLIIEKNPPSDSQMNYGNRINKEIILQMTEHACSQLIY